MAFLSNSPLTILGDKNIVNDTVHQNPVAIISITTRDNSTLWLTGGSTRDEIPLGGSTEAARISFPSIGGSAFDYISFKNTISGGSIKVVDINNSVSKYVQDKRDQNVSLYKAIIRTYNVERGKRAAASNLTGTFFWDAEDWYYGSSEIKIVDITRSTSEYIFDAVEARQYAEYAVAQLLGISIKDIQGAILSDTMRLMKHTSDYINQPATFVTNYEGHGYLLNDDTGEIIAHRGFTMIGAEAQLNYVERGALGTTALPSEVDVSAKLENRQRFVEVIYLEETAAEIICMVWTGQSINGQRNFPWGQDISREFVDFDALSRLNEQFPAKLQVKQIEKVNGKLFLEKEILPTFSGIIDVLVDGKLTVRTLKFPLQDSSYSATLNHDNSNAGKLTVDHSKIFNPIELNWGYSFRSKTYRYKTVAHFDDSRVLYPDAKTHVVNTQAIQPGLHTTELIAQMSESVGVKMSFPTENMMVKALPELSNIKKGDVVLCDYEHIPDPYSDIPSDVRLYRPFLVTSFKPSIDRSVNLGLVGFTRRPDAIKPTEVLEELPGELIENHGTLLSDVCTIDGSGNITGGAAIAPGDYYYIGDLIATGAVQYTLNAVGNKFSLWMTGTFTDTTDDGWIDLSGKGTHGGGAGATADTPARPGERGFIGHNHGGGGITVTVQARYREGDNDWIATGRQVKSLQAGGRTEGRYTAIDKIQLGYANNRLTGLPDDISGSGGAGGALGIYNDVNTVSGKYTQTIIDGAAGGRGGCGYELMCKAMAFGATTQIKTGGADASTPNITGNTYGGHGAGGDGGAGILILPSGAAAVNFSDYINASNGAANLSGAKAEKAHYHETGAPYDVRSFYDPPSPVNRAISSTVVTYFPRQSDPQSEKQRNIDAPWEDSINSLRDETEERFANTQRNKYDVFFTTHAPTGAVAYDYWAQIDNLDDDDRPIGLILLDSVWELVGRTNKEYEVQIDSYMSLTGAQRAQATADGKITTQRTLSDNPTEWPTPIGVGDLLYVKPRSQMYRSEDGVTWDVDDTFIDELAVLGGENMFADGGFNRTATGRLFWDVIGPEVEYVLSSKGHTPTATVEYGPVGEGGSYGAHIEMTESGEDEDYNGGAKVYIPARYKHPAKKGDIFAVEIRATAYERVFDDDTVCGIALRGYDKDDLPMGLIGEHLKQTNTLGAFDTEIGYIEIASNDIDYARIQSVRGELVIRGVGRSGVTTSSCSYDYVALVRRTELRGILFKSYVTALSMDTSYGPDYPYIETDTLSSASIYSENDVVTIKFSAQYTGVTAGAKISLNLGATRFIATTAEYTNVSQTDVVELESIDVGTTKTIRGEMMITGLTPRTNEYKFGYLTKVTGSYGDALYNNIRLDVAIERG